MWHARAIRSVSKPFLLFIALSGAVQGCATFHGYEGPVLNDSELATLTCYWREYLLYTKQCHITSIDGRRAGAGAFASLTAKLPPGQHWVEFAIHTAVFGAGDYPTVCAVDLQTLPQHTYRIRAHSERFEVSAFQRADPSQWPYTGSVEIEISGPDGSGIVEQIPMTCGGNLCKSDSNCDQVRNFKCFRTETSAFGRCIRQ